MKIPQIEIRQTYAKIGMDSKRATLQIEQPKAEVSIQQEPAKMEVQHTYPQVQIDQTKAWSALGKRPPLELQKVIYHETKRIVLDTIAKIAEKGDRLAAIHIKEDPIPEMAKENSIQFYEFYYEGEPSYDNVDIRVIPGRLDIEWYRGKVDIEVKPNKPVIDYIPGKLNIYMLQRNSIEILPPKIDQRI
ncbi:DUF6470 family protein [Tepidibacillus sp. HK-1]|uniref:DUF6470 family protein n=1 Tax=Tepidibacillus sp. HK-1 TaxID=1883407 RepID=UPI000853C29A|nr:DUF6470 family protein [Tepidibacillus sp. HK-1]GBF10538.1 hypothetical protein HK1_00550 [Tepidibacillus sp. HK-1]